MQPVCHIITGLGTGGAERMLVRLLSVHPENHCVLSLTGSGTQEASLLELGVPVYTVSLSLSLSLPYQITKMFCIVRKIRPRLLVGWMYHGNLAASLIGFFLSTAVIWNIRHSVKDIRREKKSLRLILKICSFFSSTPRKIVYNSFTSAEQHTAMGYASDKFLVLPNGIDTDVYKPEEEARLTFAKELDITEPFVFIGHIARYHPIKNHSGMLRAAALVLAEVPSAFFIFAGKGVDDTNQELSELIHALGISERVKLLGARNDIEKIMAALDFLVVSSWGEGFPNVVAEAMACCSPAIVTDVGDAARVVGDTGFVVAEDDTEALAETIVRACRLEAEERIGLGMQARKRVMDLFNLPRVAEEYHKTWHANCEN